MTEDDNGGVSAGRGVRLPEITPPRKEAFPWTAPSIREISLPNNTQSGPHPTYHYESAEYHARLSS